MIGNKQEWYDQYRLIKTPSDDQATIDREIKEIYNA
jgi:hypothetical protein